MSHETDDDFDFVAAYRKVSGGVEMAVPRPGELPAPEWDDAPYVCPVCHAVAPDTCVSGCAEAEMEEELARRDYEREDDDDE